MIVYPLWLSTTGKHSCKADSTEVPSGFLEIWQQFSRQRRNVSNTLLKWGGSFALPKGSSDHRLQKLQFLCNSCFQQKQCGCPSWPESRNSRVSLARSWSQLGFLVGTTQKHETYRIVSVVNSLILKLSRLFSWEVNVPKRSIALSDAFNTCEKPVLLLLCCKHYVTRLLNDFSNDMTALPHFPRW